MKSQTQKTVLDSVSVKRPEEAASLRKKADEWLPGAGDGGNGA